MLAILSGALHGNHGYHHSRLHGNHGYHHSRSVTNTSVASALISPAPDSKKGKKTADGDKKKDGKAAKVDMICYYTDYFI